MGFMQLPQPDGAATTVFYPSSGTEVPVRQGPFSLSWAPDGEPLRGNGRLVHPQEVSQAIDRVAQHAALESQLSPDSAGVFGGSAGGHTALSLAGGQWSDERFKAHCDANIEQDFSSCVGFFTRLQGNALDSLKIRAARRVIDWRFSDATVHRYRDPRVSAAVAMVPFAADFVAESLARPAVHLGLVIARKDVNQVPRFHVESIAKACTPHCEVVMDLPEASHGAMLSPMPPLEPGSVGEQLLADPPSFNREPASRAPEEEAPSISRRRNQG